MKLSDAYYWLPAWLGTSQGVGYIHGQAGQSESFAYWAGHGIFGFVVGCWLGKRFWPDRIEIISFCGAIGVVVMDLLLGG